MLSNLMCHTNKQQLTIMKKNYINPIVEIELVAAHDNLLTTSPDVEMGDPFTDEDFVTADVNASGLWDEE